MSSSPTLPARHVQYDRPDWGPLEDLIGFELADWFMWMCEFELEDGVPLHAYKHIATRRYFHLATDGRAFAYTADGRYREIRRRDAIDLAFEKWDVLRPEPEDPDAVRAALRHARLHA
jgi:hypothetical protein